MNHLLFCALTSPQYFVTNYRVPIWKLKVKILSWSFMLHQLHNKQKHIFMHDTTQPLWSELCSLHMTLLESPLLPSVVVVVDYLWYTVCVCVCVCVCVHACVPACMEVCVVSVVVGLFLTVPGFRFFGLCIIPCFHFRVMGSLLQLEKKRMKKKRTHTIIVTQKSFSTHQRRNWQKKRRVSPSCPPREAGLT